MPQITIKGTETKESQTYYEFLITDANAKMNQNIYQIFCKSWLKNTSDTYLNVDSIIEMTHKARLVGENPR